ncbi:adenosine deaminase 2 [Drosophila sulfurigaster albostrigata]|uniref:adenosine deaminase 2 n=1 Tax=Drosophila sulfurigaster albostrigata TaxID=89887 RepID=UPI002D21C40D|nr:adenosine deaminase 2 [Drosophila sulfurigaster albostrigata]
MSSICFQNFKFASSATMLKLRFCASMMRCLSRCAQKKYEPISISKSLRENSPEAYAIMREAVIKLERQSARFANVLLSPKEQAANEVIMREKKVEYNKGYLEPGNGNTDEPPYLVLNKIKETPLYSLLQKMPKGGLLHAHDTAICSSAYLVELTYRKHLWICTKNEGSDAIAFRFSKEKPTMKATKECNWEPMEEFRERRGEANVIKYLLRRFSMYPVSSYATNNAAWQDFMSIFMLLDGLLLYAPVWRDYYYNALTELHADGVQYLELRSVMPNLYCINGEQLDIMDTMEIYKSETERFKANNPDFIDAKLIYAPLRIVEPKVCEDYIKNCIAFKKNYSTFLAGFDLVGQEELGRPLIDFVEQLLKLPEDINFYFHAGETNWYGTSIDENLVDAVLLGTKRIGHGYAIIKHPLVMNMLKQLDIAVEVCPVSNQVLQLGQDYHNHPAAMLIANGVPIVISSDDPSFWWASPLTHDFYYAFLGIAPFHADLRFLKQMAMNSIRYNAMAEEEKEKAFEKWQKQWDKWIDDVAK